MMKDRLRELNIKLTELSDYVGISRPTLYKYIESYDGGDFGSIRTEVLELFRYLDTPGIRKEQALTYMISLSNGNSSDDRDIIRNYLTDRNASDEKIQLMKKLSGPTYLDELIPYLNNCLDILSKSTVTEEELHQVVGLAIMKSKVTRNVQFTDGEMKEAKTALGVKYND